MAEPITNGAPVKVFRQRTNRRYAPSSRISSLEMGCNEYFIKRWGPSKENRGPSGSKARPYRSLMRAIASRIPKRAKR